MPDTHYDVFSQWPLISTSPNTPFPITLHPARILLLRYRRRFRPIPLPVVVVVARDTKLAIPPYLTVEILMLLLRSVLILAEKRNNPGHSKIQCP